MSPKNIILALALWLGTAAPALAAQGIRHDHSGLLVWAFLGLCALIVVAQLFPALLLVLGLAKGLAAKKSPAQGHSK
jgi:hypothetical protein